MPTGCDLFPRMADKAQNFHPCLTASCHELSSAAPCNPAPLFSVILSFSPCSDVGGRLADWNHSSSSGHSLLRKAMTMRASAHTITPMSFMIAIRAMIICLLVAALTVAGRLALSGVTMWSVY
jgi:hypothetical protein